MHPQCIWYTILSHWAGEKIIFIGLGTSSRHPLGVLEQILTDKQGLLYYKKTVKLLLFWTLSIRNLRRYFFSCFINTYIIPLILFLDLQKNINYPAFLHKGQMISALEKGILQPKHKKESPLFPVGMGKYSPNTTRTQSLLVKKYSNPVNQKIHL